jgi:hypothetical protein
MSTGSQTPQAPAQAPAPAAAEAIIDKAAEKIVGGSTEALPTEVKLDVPPKQDDDFARKFAQLSRKQKQIYEQEQRMKTDRQEIEKYRRLEKLLAEDPMKFFEESKVDVNDVLLRVARQGEPPSTDDKLKSLEEKISLHEKRIEEEKKAQEAAQYKKLIDDFKGEIKLVVEKDTDKYEGILTTEGALDEIYSLIELWHGEHGEILQIDKAAQMVEDHIVENAKKLSRLKKLALTQEVEKPIDGVLTRQDPLAEPKTPSAQPTLNSKLSPEPSVPNTRKLSREESLKAAARLLKWS